MLKNIELNEIWDRLSKAKSVVLMPHIRPDGDAVGSCSALALALINEGVECKVYTTTPIADYVRFLNTSMFTDDLGSIAKPEVCVAVDCNDAGRLDERFAIYENCEQRFTIDHHIAGEGFGDRYYIDESEAAVCAIVYKMLSGAGLTMTTDMLNSLYSGISSDTGNFKHSNTTPEIMRIAADLLELGAEHREIMVNIYESVAYDEVKCKSRALAKAEFFADGKICLSYLTKKEFDELGVTDESADSIIDLLRDIAGVEIAGFLFERGDEVKVSMRSKTYADVQKIAKDLGGGGHVKASGVTLKMPIGDAFETIRKKMEKAL